MRARVLFPSVIYCRPSWHVCVCSVRTRKESDPPHRSLSPIILWVEERPPLRESEKFVTLGNRIVRKNVAMAPDQACGGLGCSVRSCVRWCTCRTRIANMNDVRTNTIPSQSLVRILWEIDFSRARTQTCRCRRYDCL